MTGTSKAPPLWQPGRALSRRAKTHKHFGPEAHDFPGRFRHVSLFGCTRLCHKEAIETGLYLYRLRIETVFLNVSRETLTLFSDTELGKNHSQKVFNVDSPGEAAKSIGRGPQVLRPQLQWCTGRDNGSPQAGYRDCQFLEVAGTGRQILHAVPAMGLRKVDQTGFQIR